MKYSTIPLAQALVQACDFYQVHHIVISPGSRNAPLTLGFTKQAVFKNFSIVDERSAAFFALGLAQQLQKPVALVCTSGSALLNYYPALSEAYYSRIPLIVLSADRPSHLIDIGDGQTIRQENVFANHIGFSAQLKENPAEQAWNEQQISQAFLTAFSEEIPVHLNIPFDEPLYGLTDEKIPFRFKKLNRQQASETVLPEALTNAWTEAKKILVIAGCMPPETIQHKATEKLMNDQRVVVLTETTSNWHHPLFINSIDKLIAPLKQEELTALQPDVLITVGGQIVSKKVKAFLRKNQNLSHFHIGKSSALDTFFCLQSAIPMDINEIINRLPLNETTSSYQEKWLFYKAKHAANHQKYLSTIPFSDLKTFDVIFKTLPEGIHLQLSNSATVRYSQLFDLPPTTTVFCNRGTSGIDGSTSTAVGAAWVRKEKTVFISGDISFFYDSNAFWNHYVKKDLLVIVINNGGGGIFRILPGAENSEAFATYFETIHQRTAETTAQTFGFKYFKAENESQLTSKLQTALSLSDVPTILEVFTPRLINDKILTSYFKSIG